MENAMRATLFAALLFAVALAGAQAQQLYRWVDKDGGVHYTQQPPPRDAKEVQRRSSASSAPEAPELPYATQLAAKNFPVTIYTAPDCAAACKDARESLEKRGVPYDEVVVGDDRSFEELKRLTGKSQVPVLRIGTQTEVGYEPEGWKAALDIAGYPESGPRARGRIKGDTASAASLPPVKLYTSADCGELCDGARSLLAARGIKFQEVEVSVSTPETIEDLAKVSGNTSVPVLLVGQRVQRGFEVGLYEGILDTAGFPRAKPAPSGTAAKK
jgi:glutaredoxin